MLFLTVCIFEDLLAVVSALENNFSDYNCITLKFRKWTVVQIRKGEYP